MAKKSVNKSQAVRDYLAAHPEAMPKDVRAALAKEGLEVSRVLVSTVKNKVNKKAATKKTAPVAATPAVPPAAGTPTNGVTITLEQVKKVAHMLNRLGGIQCVTEVLEVIKELGGVKKFRELAEAMSVTGMDDIPF
jgi:hypothetical protein